MPGFWISREIMEDYVNLQYENIKLKELITLQENKLKLYAGMEKELEKQKKIIGAQRIAIEVESMVLLGLISGIIVIAVIK